jgi:nicotinate phosphoribosyltransferase
MIYKLVEVERGGKAREAAKLTRAKATYPGRKQVFRHSSPAGKFAADKIALENEPENGQPLLIEIMRDGRRVVPPEPLSALRDRCMAGLAQLPERYRQITRAANYPVRYSKGLKASLEKLRKRVHLSGSKIAV